MSFTLNTPVANTQKMAEPSANLKVSFPSRSLRDRFKSTCALNGKNMNEVIIEFIYGYVDKDESSSTQKGKQVA